MLHHEHMAEYNRRVERSLIARDHRRKAREAAAKDVVVKSHSIQKRIIALLVASPR